MARHWEGRFTRPRLLTSNQQGGTGSSAQGTTRGLPHETELHAGASLPASFHLPQTSTSPRDQAARSMSETTPASCNRNAQPVDSLRRRSQPVNLADVGPVGFLAWFRRISCPRVETGPTSGCHVAPAAATIDTVGATRPGDSAEGQPMAGSTEGPSCGGSRRSDSLANHCSARHGRGSLQTWRDDFSQPATQLRMAENPVGQGYPPAAAQGKALKETDADARFSARSLQQSPEGRSLSSERPSQGMEAKLGREWQKGAEHMFAPFWQTMAPGKDAPTFNDTPAVANSTGASGLDMLWRQGSANLDNHSRSENQELERREPMDRLPRGMCVPELNSFDNIVAPSSLGPQRRNSREAGALLSRGPVLGKRKPVARGALERSVRQHLEQGTESQTNSGVSGVLHPMGSQLRCLADTFADRHHLG